LHLFLGGAAPRESAPWAIKGFLVRENGKPEEVRLIMMRDGEVPMSEVKRVGRKYWWIVPITVAGTLSIAMLLTVVLPKKYTSKTLVLIDQPSVSADIVKPVVSEASNQRLASMQQEILSRTHLQPIIEKFGLYPEDRGSTHIDDLILRLHDAITVSPLEAMPGTQQHQMPGFQISVVFNNPQTAQRICSEITTMFMEQNAKYMDEKSTSTTRFVSQHVEEAKQKLDDQDAKLADFKRHYIGSLPDSEQTNLSLLGTMNSQLDASTQALNRTQQDKSLNESLLSTQLANWKQASNGSGNPETLEQQLTALEDLLSTLESRYTAQHPDVIKTKSQIEELKKQIAAGPRPGMSVAPTRASATEPQQIQQLRLRIRQDDLDIADLSKRQAQIQSQINTLQGRLQSSPAVEQQYKELTRNYQTALDFYNDLLKKRDQSEIAGDLNHQQEGEHFNVLDPPSLPLQASFPNPLFFAGGGLAAGLLLSAGIIYLLAALDKAMHTILDVEYCLKLPVLAAVPILNQKGKGHGRSPSLNKSFELTNTRS
jgi:polysaccharide chain length determinant protein (PEP-CTERM system associated)